MKYIILLASGLADEPIEALNGQTPLEAAHTPALDELSSRGKIGCVRTLPDDLPPCEEVALLSALGYDPHKYFCGEAGLALADSGIRIGHGQMAFRHNLVTEADGVIVDHAAGQISVQEAEALLTSLQAALGRPEVICWAGRGFSGVTALPVSEDTEPECVPPEDVLGQAIDKHLPKGRGTEICRKVMALSREVFREHEVNRVRADLGENPADMLWLWGPGPSPALPPFESRHGLYSSMVAAAESARGLGRLSAMRVPHISGATGGYRTDYTAKAHLAVDLLGDCDLVVLHVASPAEASLEGNPERKKAAIEDIDAMIIAEMFELAANRGDTRVLFLPTHTASTSQRKRLRTEVPAAIYGPGIEPLRRAILTEATARTGELGIEEAHELLPYFLTR